MKIIITLITVLALAGCATQAPSVSENMHHEYTLEAKYYTAINELPLPINETNTEKMTLSVLLEPSEPNTTSYATLYSQDYAVKCNFEKTECKHSTIKPTLTYKVIKNVDGTLTVTGEFHSQAGREVKYESDLGYIKRTVHTDVPVWIEEKSVLPFTLSTNGKRYVELTAKTGNKLVIEIK
ncbi:hypothetical protein CSB62_17790 [Vibrio splendidus]|uniref:hypothetical protein n=1 Tax=Vibrio splendidus TaxID=29497 RepID=UPI00036D7A55|nr:hypothetical protein [Vibrio splendidus]PHN84296.1 hypothetical protein CSB62_17790 [Vibrio splendidus]